MKAVKDKLIFLVRHGERMDLLENQDLSLLKLGQYDTELTDLGHSQAFQVGQKIKEFLKSEGDEVNKDKIEIISSPFARTIQTSAKLIKGLGVDKKLIVENGLAEHLNPKWYPIPPKDFLVCYRDKESNESKCLLEFMQDQEVQFSQLTELPTHPETKDSCFKRVSETYDMIIPYYLKTSDVLIIVTHYLALEYFMHIYHKQRTKIPLEYCLTYVFKYFPDTKGFEYVTKMYP
jgi:broad specificity phosphatase PhoE